MRMNEDNNNIIMKLMLSIFIIKKNRHPHKTSKIQIIYGMILSQRFCVSSFDFWDAFLLNASKIERSLLSDSSCVFAQMQNKRSDHLPIFARHQSIF